MLCTKIRTIITSAKNERPVRISALIVFGIATLLAVSFSILASLYVITSYILGFCVSWSAITYKQKVSFGLQRLASYCRGRNKIQTVPVTCGICNNLACQRHPFEPNITPWKNIYIDSNLNDAIEHLYNRIIDTFIHSWYSAITVDPSFPNELRYCLRYATASLLNRIIKLDVGNIIGNKLVPCIVKHVDDFMYMQQFANLRNTRMNSIAVEYLGNRLHIAVTNRKNELNYLKNLTESLLPHTLPADYLKCKNYFVLIREIFAGWVLLPLMDILADPNIINYLVIYCATRKPSETIHSQEDCVKVQLLYNFSNKVQHKSSFATDLKSVRKSTDLLYCFMQFLKRQRSVHLLQFCLDVDEFNNKLLTPDLSKQQLENLHNEATKLYKEYFLSETPNFIGCSQEIVDNYKEMLTAGVYSVAKFRTSEPLYQAYEYALNILENELLPSFFLSNEFYSHICGSKLTASYSKTSVNRGRKYCDPVSHSAVSKISSSLGKIRGALKTNQPVEGAIYAPECQAVENGTVDDIIITDCSNIFRDLSSWRVSIPSSDTLQSGAKIILYNITVERLDVIESDSERSSWTVQRKDQDFHTLKGKLIEFHGESEINDCPFPPRRTSVSTSVRRHNYESFLKSLLQKPSLRGSDLLYTFLTTEQDFTLVVTTAVTAVGDLGNIYQSVANKLRKEKGQNLDSFITTFLTSTGRSRQGKFEWAELGDELDNVTPFESQKYFMPKTFKNSVFNDNYGVTYDSIKQSTSSPFSPNNMTEAVFYILKNMFKVPHGVLKLYAAICSVGQQAVDSLLRLYIEYKLKNILTQSNLAHLVALLEGAIFNPHIPLTMEEKEHRRLRAVEEISKACPSIVNYVMGEDFKIGLETILEILQNPLYNKQLIYNLLDILMVEIYPELKFSGSEQQ